MTPTNTIDFRSLDGIEIGVTKLSDMRSRFGEPEAESISAGHNVGGGSPGGDLFWDYPTRGVWICVYRDNIEATDPAIDEARLSAPFASKLPCGLYISQPLASARELIEKHFRITVEYEDSIYFTSAVSPHLTGCVENWETEEVVTIELMPSSTE